MYRNEKYGYIFSQSAFNSLTTGSHTYDNMLPPQMLPKITVALPLNYDSGNNNKVLFQMGLSTVLIHINNVSAKSTHFGFMYPLLNP